jgi:2'-hydroxyisoflavone reductase
VAVLEPSTPPSGTTRERPAARVLSFARCLTLAPMTTGSGCAPCLPAAGISSGSPPLRPRFWPALADRRPFEPIRLLILGGTGFIGPHQVRYALARGHHVTIFNRGRQKEAWPGGRGADWQPRQRSQSSGGWRLGRLYRQSDVAASLGARRRPRAEGPRWPVRLYLDHFGICRQRQAGRRDRPTPGIQGRRPMVETTNSLSADPRLYGPLKALSEKER